MIIEEQYSDTLVKHYSDLHMKILQNETDIIYDEAIDIIPCKYTYSETDIPIDPEPEEEENIY